jgi:hypothetical protein
MTTFDVMDELMFAIHADVVNDGACVQSLSSASGTMTWTHTIGLLERGHPEVIVFGLDPAFAGDLLWSLVAEIEEGVVRPVGRTRRQRDLGCPPMGLRLVPVADKHWDCAGDHLLCLAAGYHGALGRTRSELRAVQLVWASGRNRTLPWHARASRLDQLAQPLLDRLGP